jgi:acetyl-CoA carboxylase biotin carboxyl carrier protein
MDLRKVKKLIELAEESDLSELEVSGSDESVRIVRNQIQERKSPGESPIPAGIVVSASPAQEVSASEATYTMSSPMAGTFYRAPSPESDPFVTEGQVVVTGQVVCIIESMKMMHEIKAIRGGEISRVCVENGDPVGTADPLFELR